MLSSIILKLISYYSKKLFFFKFALFLIHSKVDFFAWENCNIKQYWFYLCHHENIGIFQRMMDAIQGWMLKQEWYLSNNFLTDDSNYIGQNYPLCYVHFE